jgi:DNA-directed RNA polymerase specialized sigma24 family protein
MGPVIESQAVASDQNFLTDSDLRARIIAGLAATAELQERFRKPMERFLASMCDRADGRSQERAVEIAGQILAECFAGKPSLLEKWQGGENLEAFLRKAAANRLKSWWVSSEKKRMDVNSESPVIQRAAGPPAGVNRDEIALAGRALRSGVLAAMKSCPEGLVFLRLKGLYGVDQRLISQCWGHHEAQTSRRIREVMEIIRSTASAEIQDKGLELSMDSLQEALQLDPSVLFGDDDESTPVVDDLPLRKLAACQADKAVRTEAVGILCNHPPMLGFFARLLNQNQTRDTVVVKDPALSGMAARLAECVRRSLEILQPAEACGMVTPMMSGLFLDVLKSVGADGGTLWLLCPGAATLEAVFNPLEPEIAGRRQPLVSGIVSLVLATGESACVSHVAGHERHSPAIDIALGKSTRSMIAVPFVPGGSVRGVITAVRLHSGEPFGRADLRTVERHAEIFAELFVNCLTKRILG